MMFDSLCSGNKFYVYWNETSNSPHYISNSSTIDNPPTIKKVIFNDPATIVYWEDNTKTVVKTQGDETFDKEKGLAMAFIKKVLGNKGNFNDLFRKWCAD